VVSDVRDVSRDAFSDEHRRDHVDVGKVRAAAVVRIVGEEHVAGTDFGFGIALQDLVDRTDHRSQVDGYALRECDHLARAIENRRRTIRALFDIRRKSGAHERRAHFLGGREEEARDHFGFDRIYRSDLRIR
jgi:hypothetical protein